MKTKMMFALGLSVSALAVMPGCNNGTNTNAAYESAINDHFKATPVCIWSQPKKFPVQAATSDDSKTEGYDALTQAGLLTRTTAEKKVLIVASKQVNNYDLSDSGKSTWTADPTQPGYGNFCYGHREVSSIDNAAVANNANGVKTATIDYHYKIGDVASWAKSQEMQTAFPSIATALNNTSAAHATLTQNGNSWAYSAQ